MTDDDPYLSELASVDASNPLHRLWLEYALTLSRRDALLMVRNGMAHQARAIKSMVREVLGGRKDVPLSIYAKLETLVQATIKSSATIRAGSVMS